MRIKVGNRIVIENPTSSVLDWARKNLVLPNPDYYKLERMGKWTGNTPDKIFLYETYTYNSEKHPDELWLPFGVFDGLWRMFPHGRFWESTIHDLEHRNYKQKMELYDYQRTAVDVMRQEKNGILIAPCGSGKTQMGLAIVAEVGGRALWLTHTQDLLKQSKARAENVLEIDGRYGTITEGKVDIGSHITFATVQTMSKINLTEYRDCFDVVIVDECHHACGSPTKVTQFYKVLSALSARYKIGLTATAKRTDGLERSMFALLGDIVWEVDKECVKDTVCPIEVQVMNTGWRPDDYADILQGDGTIDYSKVIDVLISDKVRADYIEAGIRGWMKRGAMLVLANRLAYLEELQKRVGGNTLMISGAVTSKKAKAERAKALTDLNEGRLDCIFATYQLAKEGLDVPNLRTVIFATPEKNEITVTQAVGRVGRKADGKTEGLVVDYVDEFSMYKGWLKTRMKYYKKLECKIL